MVVARVLVAGVPVATRRVQPAALSWRQVVVAAVVASAVAVVGAPAAPTRVWGPVSAWDFAGVAVGVGPAVGCGAPAAVVHWRAASVAAAGQVSVAGPAGHRAGRPTGARVADHRE